MNQIPTTRQIVDKFNKNEKLTAMEEFVGTYMPIDTDKGRDEFKRQLKNLIEEIESNCKKAV